MKLPDVSSKYGAPMGRHTILTGPEGAAVSVANVPIDRGGYDSGGAYWGTGLPLYAAMHDNGGQLFHRAIDNYAATRWFRERWPSGNFRGERRMLNRRRKYAKELKEYLREDDLKYDPYGTAMSWWWSICAVLWNRNIRVPHFQPGCTDDADTGPNGPILEDYPTDALLHMDSVLDRYVTMLKRNDKEY